MVRLTPCLVYFAMGEPVQMVKAGGIVLACMLPIIGVVIVYLRHTRLPAEVAPTRWATLGLWGAAGLIAVVMTAYALLQAGMIRG